MGIWTRGLRKLRSRQFVVGVLVAPAVFVLLLRLRVLLKPATYESLSTLGSVLVVIAVVALLFSRRWPLTVFGGLAVVTLGTVAVDGAYGALVFAVAVAAFMATSGDGRTAVGAMCGGVAVALGLVGLVRDGDAWQAALNVALGIGLFGAVGLVAHHRRQRLAEVEERARLDERLRIARELHDVVGHHIALITVQATVAAHVLDSRPDEARTALSHVRQAGRTVLEEISVLLGVLHQPDDTERAPAEPVPSLARLDGLIASFTTAGLPVDHTGLSPSDVLPTAVDLAAYRIVQESLTNVVKHAGGARTAVTLVRADGELRVEVRNARGAAAAPTMGDVGRGMAGMRARVSAVGGRLETGATPDGGFRVRAVLPVPGGGTDR